MRSKRIYPRYNSELEAVKAYFPERDEPLRVANLSLKGCFIPTKNPPKPGTIVNFFLELPYVGKIPVRAMVMHQGSPDRPGMGLFYLEIKDRFYLVYAKFLKALKLLEESRNLYESIVKKEAEAKEGEGIK